MRSRSALHLVGEDASSFVNVHVKAHAAMILFEDIAVLGVATQHRSRQQRPRRLLRRQVHCSGDDVVD